MKIHIDEMHQGGVVLDGEEYKGVRISYSIVDGETGRSLTDREFSAYDAAEAYIAQHYSGCERWTPPPPSAEELAELMRVLYFLEPQPSAEIGAARGIRAVLTFHLHQRSHDSGIVTRVKSVLARYFNELV